MHVAARERCVLVGHSFGSFVVRTYAARHPAYVAGIVLIDPPTEWLDPTPQRARMLRGAIYLSRIGAVFARLGIVRACAALLTGGVPAAPRAFVKIFGPPTARTLERLVGGIRSFHLRSIRSCRRSGVNQSAFTPWPTTCPYRTEWPDMGALAPPIEVPTIVISSRDQPQEQIAAHRLLAEGSLRESPCHRRSKRSLGRVRRAGTGDDRHPRTRRSGPFRTLMPAASMRSAPLQYGPDLIRSGLHMKSNDQRSNRRASQGEFFYVRSVRL
jgi:hypothetical protein